MRAATLSLCLFSLLLGCADSMPISSRSGGTLSIDGGPADAATDGGTSQPDAAAPDASAGDASTSDAGPDASADAADAAEVDCEAAATAEWTPSEALTSSVSDVVVRINGSLEASAVDCVPPDAGCPDAGDCCLNCSASLHLGEVEVVPGACAAYTGCSGQRCGSWEMISCSPPTGPASLRGRIFRGDAGVRLELYGLD